MLNKWLKNDFKPEPLKSQLSQIDKGSIELTESERIQATAYYDAFIDAIQEIVKKIDTTEILVGIGMPGIKSIDGRGIIAMANGPRMPKFSSEIESRLIDIGVNLIKPIAQLGSDADYSGIGEEYAKNGSFRTVENTTE